MDDRARYSLAFRGGTASAAFFACALLISGGRGCSAGRRAEKLAAALAAGEAAFREQRFEDAAAGFADATKVDPSSKVAWNCLGNSDLALSRYPDALNAYGRALDLDPSFTSALLGRGMAYWLQGDLGDAETDYRRLVKTAPDRVLYYIQLEKVLNEQKRYEEVADLWQSGRDAHPGDKNWDTTGRVAQALYLARSWDRLRRVCDEALERVYGADAVIYRFYRGVARSRGGDASGALEDLESVWESRPNQWKRDDYLRLFEELVVAASADGRTEKAETYRQLFDQNCRDYAECRP